MLWLRPLRGLALATLCFWRHQLGRTRACSTLERKCWPWRDLGKDVRHALLKGSGHGRVVTQGIDGSPQVRRKLNPVSLLRPHNEPRSSSIFTRN